LNYILLESMIGLAKIMVYDASESIKDIERTITECGCDAN